MRLADIAAQLKTHLPRYTDAFGDNLDIVTVTVAGGVATVTTATPHNLVSGQVVTLAGIETRTPITAVSTDGLVHTFATGADHDLTLGWHAHELIHLRGFTNPFWNTHHSLLSVPNRRSFRVQANQVAPTLNGQEILLEYDRADGLNGAVEIAVIDDDTFAFSAVGVSAGTYTPINGKVIGSPRVSVAVHLERCLQLFSSQGSKLYAFVIPQQGQVSRDRTNSNDAVASRGSGTDFRLRMIERFAVLIAAPCHDESGAEAALDLCRDTLMGPLMRSLYGFKPAVPANTQQFSDMAVVPTHHGIEYYDKAILLYGYGFEAPFDLTLDQALDTSEPTRALRDILGGFSAPGVQQLDLALDTDADPL